MFLVNCAWTSSPGSPVLQQIEEHPANTISQNTERDILAQGGGSGSSAAERSTSDASYYSIVDSCAAANISHSLQGERNRNSSKMREIAMEDLEIAMKVVIVGNGSVGKSSMIQRFCRGIFTRDYKKTIGVDFLERILSVDDQPVRLMLWDTAGQEEFDAITRTYYRGANACVLACSITDKDSFLALPKWKNKVCRECGDVPMVIVANKIDLQKESVVDSAELEGMARSLGIPKLIRTSVKDDLNVSTVFSYLAQSYMQSILGQISGLDSHDPSYADPMMITEANSLHAPLFFPPPHHSPTSNKASSPQSLQYLHPQQKGLITNNSSGKKGSSNNYNHQNQVALMNGSNKSNNKTGKSLFRNPIILKSSQPINGTQQQQSPPSNPSPPPNINNSTNNNSNAGGGFGSLFSSSKTKQNNNYNSNHHQQNNNYQQHAQHHNLFHRNRSSKYPTNVLPPPVALINGQMMHRPSPYAPFINGGLAGRDPRHWNDNIPFRLDLVKDRKRRKETSSCTIL